MVGNTGFMTFYTHTDFNRTVELFKFHRYGRLSDLEILLTNLKNQNPFLYMTPYAWYMDSTADLELV